MNKDIFLQRLKDDYPDADIRISKRGERLLVNGHVIKGFLMDDNMFRAPDPEEAADFLAGWVENHFKIYGDMPGEYYGEKESVSPKQSKKQKQPKKPKHPKNIEKYNGTINELADDISNLHYETLEYFLKRLSDKIFIDSMKDSERNRYKLANALNEAHLDLNKASKHIGEAWKISEPYM